MTDIQKIREEVARIQLYTQSEVLKQILDFIDSMQEEPVSEEFEEALAREWQGYNDRGAATVDALEDNAQELTFAKGFYRGWKHSRKESISEDLEEAAREYSFNIPSEIFCDLSPTMQSIWKHEIESAFKDGVNWQKESLWKPADGDMLNFQKK
jgi:hypothetical protein